MSPGHAFIARIDGVLSAGGVGEVARAVLPGHAGIPRDASLMELPRVMICLEDRAKYELNGESGTTNVSLAARDGLFVAPGRWVRARPREPYVLMGVVFYAAATRFYLMRGAADRDGRALAPVENHVVPSGISEDGRVLGRLLAGEAPPGMADRFYHHAFECLLFLARGLLVKVGEADPVGGKARFTWHAACNFIEENLHRTLCRKDVARHLCIHPNHLSRLFAEFGRETFTEHLQARRLERARLLLEEPQLNIAEVARLSGFASANSFTRVFRQATGKTPTRTRK
jgi:AraC-like DNA-binding protein